MDRRELYFLSRWLRVLEAINKYTDKRLNLTLSLPIIPLNVHRFYHFFLARFFDKNRQKKKNKLFLECRFLPHIIYFNKHFWIIYLLHFLQQWLNGQSQIGKSNPNPPTPVEEVNCLVKVSSRRRRGAWSPIKFHGTSGCRLIAEQPVITTRVPLSFTFSHPLPDFRPLVTTVATGIRRR